MYEPKDYPRMMLGLAIGHQREAGLDLSDRAGAYRAACDRILETLAELWQRPVREFWHETVDAAFLSGLPCYEEAGRLLDTLRQRWAQDL